MSLKIHGENRIPAIQCASDPISVKREVQRQDTLSSLHQREDKTIFQQLKEFFSFIFNWVALNVCCCFFKKKEQAVIEKEEAKKRFKGLSEGDQTKWKAAVEKFKKKLEGSDKNWEAELDFCKALQKLLKKNADKTDVESLINDAKVSRDIKNDYLVSYKKDPDALLNEVHHTIEFLHFVVNQKESLPFAGFLKGGQPSTLEAEAVFREGLSVHSKELLLEAYRKANDKPDFTLDELKERIFTKPECKSLEKMGQYILDKFTELHGKLK